MKKKTLTTERAKQVKPIIVNFKNHLIERQIVSGNVEL